MISTISIGVAAAMVTVIIFTHKSRGFRSRLLRYTSIALFVATFLRQADNLSFADLPVIELVKTVAMLIAEACIILLMLTFREKQVTRHEIRLVVCITAMIATVQAILLPFIPTAPGGGLYFTDELLQTPLVAIYSGLYNISLGIAVVIVGIGCGRVMLQQRQPIIVRVSLGLVTAGAFCAGLYVSLGALTLAGTAIRFINTEPTSNTLFLIAISFTCAGLFVGGLRKFIVDGQDYRAINAAIGIVEPLWKVAVALHPDVVLMNEKLSRRERLIRLVVETNDVFTLVRDDRDRALDIVRERYADDPELTAGLLMHLLGDNAIPSPPPSRSTFLTRTTKRLKDENLASSIKDLYNIQLACANRDQWWKPCLPI